MGCLKRAYPRLEYLEALGLLDLKENSYDKVKLSLKNPDYKEIALNKFIHAYVFDLTAHGLKIDFDRFTLMHLIGYKTLIEPYTSDRHGLNLDRLKDIEPKLWVMLENDEMLKAFKSNLEGFKHVFENELKHLTPKQRIEVVANLVRQFSILQGGNYDIVDKWIGIEKSLGLHVIKRLTSSPLFWNYFMITITLREHYSSLLEKEEILAYMDSGGYIKPDDWQVVKKWYDRAGSLTDHEYHLKNAQENIEKFLLELDWIPFLAGELGSEALALRIAKGITSFLWNTAKVASIILPAGRLARGAYLVAKWFSQSIIAFASWLGIEWALDGAIQWALRKPMEAIKDLLELPNRKFWGLTKEEFEYLVNYFVSKEVKDINIFDPEAGRLFANLTPKGQAVVLGIIHRARIRGIAREGIKRIKEAVKDLLNPGKIVSFSMPANWNDCIDADLPDDREMRNKFTQFVELKDAESKLSFISITGNDEHPVNVVSVEDFTTPHGIGKRFTYLQPSQRKDDDGNPYPPSTGTSEMTYNVFTGIDSETGLPVKWHVFGSNIFIDNPCKLIRWEEFDWSLMQRVKREMVFYSAYRKYFDSGIGYYHDCNTFFEASSVRQQQSTTFQVECEAGIISSGSTSYFSQSRFFRKEPFIKDEYSSGEKVFASLVKLLLTLKPSYLVRIDRNTFRLYFMPKGIYDKKSASKVLILPDYSGFYTYGIIYNFGYEMSYRYMSIYSEYTRGNSEEVSASSKRSGLKVKEKVKAYVNYYSNYSYTFTDEAIYVYRYEYMWNLPYTKKTLIERINNDIEERQGDLDIGSNMKYDSVSDSLTIPIIDDLYERKGGMPQPVEDIPDIFDDINFELPECVNKIPLID